jgi:hypothetical protein
MTLDWLVLPLRNDLPAWVAVACAVPGFLVFVVLFLELELTGYAFVFSIFRTEKYFQDHQKTSQFLFLLEFYIHRVMLSAKHRKLCKGTGFHLDLLLSCKCNLLYGYAIRRLYK